MIKTNTRKYQKKYGAKIRPIVIKKVEKFRDCGDPKSPVFLKDKTAMPFFGTKENENGFIFHFKKILAMKQI